MNRSVTLIIFLLLLSSVFALSASPASKTIRTGGTIERYTLTLTNDEMRDLDLTISAIGPLAPYITIPSKLSLTRGSSSKIQVTISVPSIIEEGESGILVESAGQGEDTVTATTAVLHVIKIKPPIQGQSISGSLLGSAGAVGTPIILTLSLYNDGTEPVSTTPILRIGNQTFTLEPIVLNPGESKDFTTSWDPKEIGVYTGSAVLSYGGSEKIISNSFTVGTLSVNAINVTQEETAESITKYSVLVENQWYNPLPTTAHIDLYKGKTLVGSGNSAPVQVAALGTAQIPVYIEANAPKGTFSAVVNLRYANYQNAESFILHNDEVPIWQKPLWPVLFAVVVIILAIIFRRRTKGKKRHSKLIE